MAAEEGHVDCVRLLLEGGADKDAMANVRALVLFVCECAEDNHKLNSCAMMFALCGLQ